MIQREASLCFCVFLCVSVASKLISNPEPLQVLSLAAGCIPVASNLVVYVLELDKRGILDIVVA